jgi:hypothetical protein
MTDELGNSRHKLHSGPGVYCIVESGEIIYIGQSKNCGTRALQHPMTNSENVNAHSYETDSLHRKVVEGFLIYVYQPKYNCIQTPRDIQKFRKFPETARKVVDEHGIPDEALLKRHINNSDNTHRLKEMSLDARLDLHNTELPAQKKLKVRDRELMAQFMDLKNDLEERNGKYSVQATLEYAIRLAYQRLEDVRQQDDKLSEVAENVQATLSK